MTQIQALETMSQTDLVKLIQTERQQHADDMDMLSKELASKSLAVPTNAEPVVMGYGDVAVGGAIRRDDGTPGIIYLRLPEVREHNADCSDIYPVGRAAPDGSVLACIYFGSSEVLQQTIDVLLKLQREHYPTPQPGVLTILDENTVAAVQPIAPVAPQEPDQALLISMACCLHHGFGLLSKNQQDSMLQEMRKLWDEVMGHGYYSPSHRDRYTAMLAPVVKDSLTVDMQCTCPSGNGSLRWPCPVHPPESVNLMKWSNQQASSTDKKHGFTECVFIGDPPSGYESWAQWGATPIKKGVQIMALTKCDHSYPDNAHESEKKVQP